jgi:hypothetical protein
MSNSNERAREIERGKELKFMSYDNSTSHDSANAIRRRHERMKYELQCRTPQGRAELKAARDAANRELAEIEARNKKRMDFFYSLEGPAQAQVLTSKRRRIGGHAMTLGWEC